MKITKHHGFIWVLFFLLASTFPQVSAKNEEPIQLEEITIDTYTPTFLAKNIKETMTLSPIFTPDNALSTHVGWINEATTTIDIQNQYIKFFDTYDDWNTNPTPFVDALLKAKNRGVTIRVQVREDSDSSDVAPFLKSKGIDARYMGNSTSAQGDYLSATHNKLLIVDKEVVLVSSINFGSAFTNNREAGMVIENANAALYFTDIFESDWLDGEQLPPSISKTNKNIPNKNMIIDTVDYPSHTDIPRTNFTGVYNITLFVNPDNAADVIFKSLSEAKESIYVSMYTISRPDFNNTLIELKKANPSINIEVLISSRRVGGSENIDTWSAVRSLVDNAIPVYNASVDAFYNLAGFYHNKYWIIDGKHTFVYSGNWSPRSVTSLEEGKDYFASGDPNRDMGVAVHDATDIAEFYKNVWDQDVAVADEWELPIGIKQLSFKDADIVNGNVDLSGLLVGLEGATVSYRLGAGSYTTATLTDNAFSETFDTTKIANGITTFEVKAEVNSQIYTDEVTVNIVNFNYEYDNWRFLITELLPNPVGTDSAAEFFELTNSFPFALLIEDWQAGDDGSKLLQFPAGTKIEAYTSIIIANNKAGFESAFGKIADYESKISLKNTGGDYIRLLDNRDNFIDVVAYGDTSYNVDALDGSEKILITSSGVSSGESFQRKELHIDTNKAVDFISDTPDPKGSVPNIALGGSVTSSIIDTSSELTEVPVIIYWGFILIVLIPIINKRKK